MEKIHNNTAHAVSIIEGSTFDATVRKYRGGKVLRTFPAEGLLNAQFSKPEAAAESLGGVPTTKAPVVVGADPIPKDGDYHIVSVAYLNAARALGWATDRLLTVGQAVVDESCKLIGATGLVRN